MSYVALTELDTIIIIAKTKFYYSNYKLKPSPLYVPPEREIVHDKVDFLRR